jgi:hypothetical protein
MLRGYGRLLLGIVVLILILTVFFTYTLNGHFLLFGPEDEAAKQKLPLWETATCAISMLLGLVSGVVSEHLKRKGGPINLFQETREALTSASFFKALLASPILFSGVYIASQRQPDPVIALIFAFENGFLCDTILRDKNEKRKHR